MHIRRTGPSNQRLTHDKIYLFNQKTQLIRDDKGNTMKPELDSGYWEIIDNIDEPTPYKPKETTMKKSLTIKTVTYVNGTAVEDLSSNDIVNLIQQENNSKTHLENVNKSLSMNSVAIEKLVNKHQRNIEELLKILETISE